MQNYEAAQRSRRSLDPGLPAWPQLYFLLPLSLLGQSGAATIQGTVQDASGPPCPRRLFAS